MYCQTLFAPALLEAIAKRLEQSFKRYSEWAVVELERFIPSYHSYDLFIQKSMMN